MRVQDKLFGETGTVVAFDDGVFGVMWDGDEDIIYVAEDSVHVLKGKLPYYEGELL